MTSLSIRVGSQWIAATAALCALLPTLGGCSSSKPDKLANATSFCEEWGKKACNDTIVENCGAPDQQSCVKAQQDFCLTLVDESAYTKAGAKECLKAVADAYYDGRLDGKEMAIVLELGAPCDRVQTGDTASGGTCTKNTQCDVEGGYSCVLRLQESGDPKGECQIPKEAGGGEKCSSANVVCADGFYCNGSNCISESGEGETCSNVIPCSAELKCVISSGETEGVCQARAKPGSACKVADDCSTGICSPVAGGGLACANNVSLDFSKSLCNNFRPPLSGDSTQSMSEPATMAEPAAASDAQSPADAGSP